MFAFPWLSAQVGTKQLGTAKCNVLSKAAGLKTGNTGAIWICWPWRPQQKKTKVWVHICFQHPRSKLNVCIFSHNNFYWKDPCNKKSPNKLNAYWLEGMKTSITVCFFRPDQIEITVNRTAMIHCCTWSLAAFGIVSASIHVFLGCIIWKLLLSQFNSLFSSDVSVSVLSLWRQSLYRHSEATYTINNIQALNVLKKIMQRLLKFCLLFFLLIKSIDHKINLVWPEPHSGEQRIGNWYTSTNCQQHDQSWHTEYDGVLGAMGNFTHNPQSVCWVYRVHETDLRSSLLILPVTQFLPLSLIRPSQPTAHFYQNLQLS